MVNNNKNSKLIALAQEAIPFIEAFQLANRENARILSNKEYDFLLTEAKIGRDKQILYPHGFMWTGTFTVYEDNNKRLDAVVENIYDGIKWKFPIPIEFQNMKNAMLVVEHPNYNLEIKEKEVIVHANIEHIIPVKNIPIKSLQCYEVDKNTGIPINIKNNNGRYWVRDPKGVLPIARTYSDGITGMEVIADEHPPIKAHVLAVKGDSKGSFSIRDSVKEVEEILANLEATSKIQSNNDKGRSKLVKECTKALFGK